MVVKYPLKGVFKVTAKGRTYWYAWRGPRLDHGCRGHRGRRSFTPAMSRRMRRFARPTPDGFTPWLWPTGRVPNSSSLAPVTKKNWLPWLDRIAEHFGDLRIVQFERPQKIRPYHHPLAEPCGPRQAAHCRLSVCKLISRPGACD